MHHRPWQAGSQPTNLAAHGNCPLLTQIRADQVLPAPRAVRLPLPGRLSGKFGSPPAHTLTNAQEGNDTSRPASTESWPQARLPETALVPQWCLLSVFHTVRPSGGPQPKCGNLDRNVVLFPRREPTSLNRTGDHCHRNLACPLSLLLALVVMASFIQPGGSGMVHPFTGCAEGRNCFIGRGQCHPTHRCHRWNKGGAPQHITIVSSVWWSITTVLVSLVAALVSGNTRTHFSDLRPSTFTGRQAFMLLMLSVVMTEPSMVIAMPTDTNKIREDQAKAMAELRKVALYSKTLKCFVPKKTPAKAKHKRLRLNNACRKSDPRAICQVATWNVCNATDTKVPLILHALDQHAINICLLTETKWTYATSDWFINDSLWEAYRVDFLDTSITQLPLNKLRRGGLCLLVNKGLQARVQLLDKQDGQLTTAR